MTDHEPLTPREREGHKAGRPRRWQARFAASPRWRIAGAGAVVVAVAAIAVLAWVVIASEGDEESALTVQGVYGAIEDAIAGDGLVLRSTVYFTIDGEAVPVIESWVDAENGVLRRHILTIDDPTPFIEIVTGDWSYYAAEDGIIRRGDQVENCPGVDSAWLSAFLMCLSDDGIDSRVEYTRWEGEDAIVVTHETSDTTGGETSTFSADAPQATQTTELVYRLYIDRETYLPLATTLDSWINGQPDPFPSNPRRYVHEFIPRTPEVAALLDLRASGYGTEDSGRLAELDGIAPLYWLGEEYEDESPLHSLVLDDVVIPARNGAAGSLLYSSPSGSTGVILELWSPEQWAGFRGSSAGSILDDPMCVDEREATIGGSEFTLFEMPRINYPLPSPGTGDMDNCWWHVLNEGGMPEAGALFVHQTLAGFVSISALPTSFYYDAERLRETVAAAFQPYEPD